MWSAAVQKLVEHRDRRGGTEPESFLQRVLPPPLEFGFEIVSHGVRDVGVHAGSAPDHVAQPLGLEHFRHGVFQHHSAPADKLASWNKALRTR
jgi:hypothetical protein